jgi:hypothetical protein
MCSFGLAGGPMHIRGALVEAYFDSTFYEGPGWQVLTTTGDQIQWDANEGFNSSDNHAYFTLDTQSAEIGVEVWRVQNSMPPCWFEIYEQTPLGGGLQLVAISPEGKQEAQFWSDGFQRAYLGMATMTGYMRLLCFAGLVEACPWVPVYGGVATAMTLGKLWADYFVQDPFTDQYSVPYDPPLYSAAELGLYCEDNSLLDFCNGMNDAARYYFQFWSGAYESANRANSCAQVGNADCFYWQQQRMQWFVWAAGVWTEIFAGGVGNMADGNPYETGETRQAANEFYQIAAGMKGQCSWCY